jgi:AsmA protein
MINSISYCCYDLILGKIMKKLLYAIAALLLVFVVVIVVAVSLVNTDDIKQLLVTKTKQATGRDLVIEGDLSWRFFPSIGFELGKLRLVDPPEFGDGNTFSMDGAEMSVALLPLFSKTVEVGDINIAGLNLRYQTKADGSTNLDDLTQAGSSQTASESDPTQSQQPASSSASDWQIRLSGINVSDANVQLIDLKQNKTQLLGPVNFTLQGLELDQDNAFSMSLKYTDGELQLADELQGLLFVASDFDQLALKGVTNTLTLEGASLPNGKMNIASEFELAYTLSSKTAQLSELKVDIDGNTQLNGSSSVVLADLPLIKFDLHIPLLDSKYFLAADTQSSSKQQTPSNKESTTPSEQEPDLSALKLFNLDGQLRIDKLQHGKLHIENLKQQLSLKNAVLRLNELSAELYGGKFNTSASLNAQGKVATYKLNANLANVQARPLLSDAADFEFIAGSLQSTLKLQGKGLTQTAIKQNISGPINASFTDGAIYGINIPQMIRTTKAQLQGGDRQQAQQEQKTDFSELLLEANLGNSLATVSKAQLISPLLRVDGQGNSHLVRESLDFDFIVKVVASLEGQGAKNDLAGLNIPLKIGGNWTSPEINLDMKKLLQGQAKEALSKELNKALGDDENSKKLLDSLGSFFN